MRAAACAAISSAVELSSSAAEALRCVTWSTWAMALLIWPTPDDCSSEAAATSCTSSAVLRIDGHQLGEQLARPLGQADARAAPAPDLLRRHLAPLGQLAHLGRHHREALAVLAGPRRLDGRVQGQQVGLVGDLAR